MRQQCRKTVAGDSRQYFFPHTTIFVSSCYYLCVLIQLYVSWHYYKCLSAYYYVSSFYYIWFCIQLCVLILICVRILEYMSSCQYKCGRSLAKQWREELKASYLYSLRHHTLVVLRPHTTVNAAGVLQNSGGRKSSISLSLIRELSQVSASHALSNTLRVLH